MNARDGRLLQERSWQHAVKQDDHLSMSFVIENLATKPGHCPFPTCQASTNSVEILNGGRTCRTCGRWSQLTNLEILLQAATAMRVGPARALDIDMNTSPRREPPLNVEEDIELYRQIHVQISPEGATKSVELELSAAPDSMAVSGRQDDTRLDDSLSYLDEIKAKFHATPEAYCRFLDIMEAFKNGIMNTMETMACVSRLFAEQKGLIGGFKKFLPQGYEIQDCHDADINEPMIRTPTQKLCLREIETLALCAEARIYHSLGYDATQVFVDKVKVHLASRPRDYKQFLRAMRSHPRVGLGQVTIKVEKLLNGAPELLAAFHGFVSSEEFGDYYTRSLFHAIGQPWESYGHIYPADDVDSDEYAKLEEDVESDEDVILDS
ncbi:hypothetical protein EJ04DRAFT_526375 [Polyplosphaeria fusca]|uniref:Uncharacterized protein n=1 Tax=Polyplosphaeria fusca TaxID=682080 RepID=A0A9P4UZL1_9PLEO|nr:hypothetical protein EJ04DRAFT_526375 [Polyplosphaeria fusca]